MHAMGSAGHLAHLPMLVVPALAGGAALARERRLVTPALSEPARGRWLWLLVTASAVAAVVHAMVAPEHFEESPLYGGFFLATTVAGLGYAVWVLSRPARWLYVAAVVANVAIVALWLTTRLVEVPVGPGAGETEPFGRLDVIASSAELLCVVAAVVLLLASRSRQVRVQPAQR